MTHPLIRDRRFNAIPACLALLTSLLFLSPSAANTLSEPRVQLLDGAIQGEREHVGASDLNVYRGIPFAAPPTGSLRWREPQPVARWAGVRDATRFGPRCMQAAASRPASRTSEMSEDCLYLNVWAPANKRDDNLPVLVYLHGGGLVFGDGSEDRYDGANLAAQGIVVVTLNYRLGAFGFLALPEAARESPHGSAGNYGLLDQVAALRWVRDNIAHFGGDPQQVTLGGNSAGAISVSAHMASPLSRGLFARAFGASGAAFSPFQLWTRAQAERAAERFAAKANAASLQQLRAQPASTLLTATESTYGTATSMFWPYIDGYFLTESPATVFGAGRQAQVPLLVGANSHEGHSDTVLAKAAPTPENWRSAVQMMFRDQRNEALNLYPGNDENEVVRSATALASDLFISHSTWRWMDAHRQTGHAPVYYYLYTHPRPPKRDAALKQPVPGAEHSVEIEYALGSLEKRHQYDWTAHDREVSRVFSGYLANFVKTGQPSGAKPGALPDWPAVRAERTGFTRQIIGSQTHTHIDDTGPRHAFLQRYFENTRSSGPANR